MHLIILELVIAQTLTPPILGVSLAKPKWKSEVKGAHLHIL